MDNQRLQKLAGLPIMEEKQSEGQQIAAMVIRQARETYEDMKKEDPKSAPRDEAEMKDAIKNTALELLKDFTEEARDIIKQY